ncbi:HET-domain-containing protein [Byssothecium circinans]|uniref:HET-domain-containing protein n=1 Tax=Byssothecium circinans TaxID=147558 RepID=A0A6A5TZX3_9PLEO|nr:HET-domain-containing protein [Byssothecium circinans]
MRLIKCSTLRLEEFFGSNIPPYAILSHTWGDEEVSFADLLLSQPTTTRSGYQKILFTCQQAIKDGLDYAWIDTCCIDKSSSAELSEAINSMFAWYKNSARCYAYLSDVLEASMDEDFSRSRWFTRGWTLQELLAPKTVIFYDQQWIHLGTKSEHAERISEITGIDRTALLRGTVIDGRRVELGSFCVAKRMSWASARQTTRAEDMAYCLLGIFNVSMPLLYGEGDRAFLRLQEEISRKIDDDSILAWGLKPEMDHPLGLISDPVRFLMSRTFLLSDIFASSPRDFINCANLSYAAKSTSPFTLTNTGLQIQLPLVPVSPTNDPSVPDGCHGWIGLLSCSTGSSLEFLGILLKPRGGDDGPRARVIRAQCCTSRSNYNTLVVGSRAVVRSVLKPLTIIGMDENKRIRGYQYRRSYRQIVVNECRALQGFGYQVKSGTAWNIAERTRRRCVTTWDPKAKILTIEGDVMFRDIIELCFEPSWSRQNTNFSVFMRTISSRAIVREGDAFSKEDKRGFYDDLEQESSQHDMDNVVIYDSEGISFHVSVGIHATRVYDHRLFEVNVDAVQVVTGGN